MSYRSNCDICGVAMPRDLHKEEMGMCLDCSLLYWAHDHEGCSWGCMAELPEMIRNERKVMK